MEEDKREFFSEKKKKQNKTKDNIFPIMFVPIKAQKFI
jgi:hypothetical protein